MRYNVYTTDAKSHKNLWDQACRNSPSPRGTSRTPAVSGCCMDDNFMRVRDWKLLDVEFRYRYNLLTLRVPKCRKFMPLKNCFIWQHATSVNILSELYMVKKYLERLFSEIRGSKRVHIFFIWQHLQYQDYAASESGMHDELQMILKEAFVE